MRSQTLQPPWVWPRAVQPRALTIETSDHQPRALLSQIAAKAHQPHALARLQPASSSSRQVEARASHRPKQQMAEALSPSSRSARPLPQAGLAQTAGTSSRLAEQHQAQATGGSSSSQTAGQQHVQPSSSSARPGLHRTLLRRQSRVPQVRSETEQPCQSVAGPGCPDTGCQ